MTGEIKARVLDHYVKELWRFLFRRTVKRERAGDPIDICAKTFERR